MNPNDWEVINSKAISDRLARIEAKLDLLINALADDEEEGPTHDLEGVELPRERDQSAEL